MREKTYLEPVSDMGVSMQAQAQAMLKCGVEAVNGGGNSAGYDPRPWAHRAHAEALEASAIAKDAGSHDDAARSCLRAAEALESRASDAQRMGWDSEASACAAKAAACRKKALEHAAKARELAPKGGLMAKAMGALRDLAKAHVDGFTRKDGTQVKAHETKVQAKPDIGAGVWSHGHQVQAHVPGHPLHGHTGEVVGASKDGPHTFVHVKDKTGNVTGINVHDLRPAKGHRWPDHETRVQEKVTPAPDAAPGATKDDFIQAGKSGATVAQPPASPDAGKPHSGAEDYQTGQKITVDGKPHTVSKVVGGFVKTESGGAFRPDQIDPPGPGGEVPRETPGGDGAPDPAKVKGALSSGSTFTKLDLAADLQGKSAYPVPVLQGPDGKFVVPKHAKHAGILKKAGYKVALDYNGKPPAGQGAAAAPAPAAGGEAKPAEKSSGKDYHSKLAGQHLHQSLSASDETAKQAHEAAAMAHAAAARAPDDMSLSAAANKHSLAAPGGKGGEDLSKALFLFLS